MAKLTVYMDTDTKELKVNINGVDYNDVEYASLTKYKCDGESRCSFSIDLIPIKNENVINRTYISSAYAKAGLIPQKISEGIYKFTETVKSKKHWFFP